jgi:Tol biopolymer transport system component
LYRVAYKSANLLQMSLVTAAAMLAIWVLALVETTNTAEASSLPHNGKIAFSSNRGGSDQYDIYTVEPEGSNLSRLTNSTHWETRPIWSPDGTEMAFSDDRGDVGIPVMSADGSNLRYITTDPNITGSVSFFPTWSPDGTKLAFSSGNPPDAIFDIYTIDLDGSNQINLTKTPRQNESYADFSPDGSQMCFSFGSGGPKPAFGIYLMNADGSDPTLLFEDDSSGQCDWSPNGTKIVFNHTDFSDDTSGEGYGDAEVFVINADGSGLTNLTSNSAGDYNPRWSPDGTKITFMSNRDGGDYDIYTMDADGSDVAQVTNLGGDELDPDWQPLPGPTSPKSRSETVHPPDTGGPSLLLVASVLLFTVGRLLHAVVRCRM